MKTKNNNTSKVNSGRITDEINSKDCNDEYLNNLKVLIDDTNKLSRKEWADYLFVSLPAISQWIKGKTISSPEHLDKIILFNERFSDKKTKLAVAKFHSVADKPLIEIVPHLQIGKFKGFNRLSDFIAKSYEYIFKTELYKIPSILRRDTVVLFTTCLRAIKNQINNDSSIEDLYKMKYLLQSFSESDISKILFDKSDKIDWIHSEESLLEIERTKYSCKNVWIVSPDPIDDTVGKWATMVKENSMNGWTYTYILPKEKDFKNSFRELGKVFENSMNNCKIATMDLNAILSSFHSTNIVIYDPNAQYQSTESFSKIEDRCAWYENTPEKTFRMVNILRNTVKNSIPLNVILNDN